MKDNSLDGHRGKVALSDTPRVSSTTASTSTNGGVKSELKSPSTSTGNDGSAATNFDDDYNEWELGIGDLIIDLDADIEKTNEQRNSGGTSSSSSSGHHHHHHHHHHSGSHQNGTASSPTGSNSGSPNAASAANTFNFLGSQAPCNNSNLAAAMSNSKSPRLIGNCGTGATNTSSGSNGGSSGANSSTASGTFEHQATVDKGLKMKIKRKTVGNKYSEAKHEIVQSDTKASPATQHPLCENTSTQNCGNGCLSGASGGSCTTTGNDTPKSKHSSSKGRNSSHREKKEKRDKDKNANMRATTTAVSATAATPTDVNGVIGVMSPLKITNSGVGVASPAPPSLCSSSSPLPPSSSSSSSSTSLQTCISSRSVTNSPGGTQDSSSSQGLPTGAGPVPASVSPPMPNLTMKLETKFVPSPLPQVCLAAGSGNVVIKQEERSDSPPLKRIKTEISERNGEMDCPGSPTSPEMKDTSTCTSVGTITEPDCLGPCEPGTSVMLEGIVWQETEGGVLVVNVTWRGKTYVGTLLDCTKHDWAPPRFCESPTSDVDSKTSKGRGKRGRGGNNSSSDINAFTDTRTCVQSKLRNGKGRRTTINSNAASSGFTVPSCPAKGENGTSNSKRKGRPADLEITNTPQTESKASKRSRNQARATPTSSSAPGTPASSEFPQPSSPALIICPEPNCSKKYKHINGLRYHQTHAHSSSDGSKIDDATTEDSKDVTNSSDNEESLQESVSPSPGPTFTNTVSPHSNATKILLNENTSSSSSSSNLNGLPDSESYGLTPDLTTLASVAINESKSGQKSSSASRAGPIALHSSASQDSPAVNSADGEITHSVLPLANTNVSTSAPSPSILPTDPAVCSLSSNISITASAVTTSVIQSSTSVDISLPAVTVSIPTSHVVFNQGIAPSISNISASTYTTSSNVSSGSTAVSPSKSCLPSVNVTSTFVPISSTTSTTAMSPSAVLPMVDKNKIKQERPDKYKPKSPMATSSARPIVPAPSSQLLSLSANMPGSHSGIGMGGHAIVGSSLKPIQPKPTILGEPNIVNPALESLKKEKSKHKKKSKDRDRDREKKMLSLPLTPTKMGAMSNDECDAMELTPYPSLEAVSGSAALQGSHTALSPMVNQDGTIDITVPDDSINENIQSPAYSDISDANDTAPVLESEVPSGKEKEDKVGKTTPDAAQSPAANISAYGMYPYYSQPPYLLPSVSPQSSVSGTQPPNIGEKVESTKKSDQDRVKESRPWSNSSGENRERQHGEHHESDKKSLREDSLQNPGSLSSPATQSTPVQEYPLQQHYPYTYGYVQGYPYSIEPAYHMHLLESDPHYKQQYKQYIDEQQRLYKEQQHHHQQQQLQQHHLQQQSQHHPHQPHHHSSHQSHHQSKSQHFSSSAKEERERTRESKERSSAIDKMSSSGLIVEHPSKIQHSSLSLVSSKDHDVRELDTTPPSLPAQTRIDSSSSASAAALKEKQNENHQILKENIELKSQMDDSKNKINQYEMAMLYERHREDMRRYYMYHDRVIEQQQQKMEPGIHHHTHHHQTIQPHGHLQASASFGSSSSMKSHKDDLSSSSLPSHSKSSHYGDGARSSSVVSPAKSSHASSTSSPKGSLSSSKDYTGSSSSHRESSSSKKDSSSKSMDRSESSGRDEKSKSDKIKVEAKVEPEGQKPTMETTGPPPPPTNSYAYLHPSYLQPPPPHFPHMPFEPAHAMYRGGINPMIVSTPHYGGSPYGVHPQIRYVTPGGCELPAHAQPPDALSGKLHPSGPPKALDLLHQVSQHYTTTHKIHELQEHALMSPTPTSTPSSTPSTSSSSANSKGSSSEPVVAVSKMEVGGSRETSRSPPTQRHLHTHHHTHVGVGYPIYDPYGVTAQKSYT